MFRFDAGHPLAATHHQVLRTRYVTPVATGVGCPPYPGPKPTAEASADATPEERRSINRVFQTWRRAADRFAQYILLLHVPWGAAPPLQTYDQLVEVLRVLRASNLPLDASRYTIIHNEAYGMRVPASHARRTAEWRTRAADRWTAAEVERHRGTGAARSATNPSGHIDLRLVRNLVENAASGARVTTGDTNQQAEHRRTDALRGALSDLHAAAGVPAGLAQCADAWLLADVDAARAACAEVRALRETQHGEAAARGADADAGGAHRPRPDLAGQTNAADTAPFAPALVGLNEQQRVVAVEVLGALTQHSACAGTGASGATHAAATAPLAPQQLIMVCGGPGTGKTRLVHAINEGLIACGTDGLLCTSPTGVAATLLPGGRTLHSLFGFLVSTRSTSTGGPLQSTDQARTRVGQLPVSYTHLTLPTNREV